MRRINNLIKMSAFILSVIVISVCCRCQLYAKELAVNITNTCGESIIVKDSGIIYSAIPLVFTLQSEEDITEDSDANENIRISDLDNSESPSEYSYCLSTDNGKTFGEYITAESNTIMLVPDINIAASVNYVIKFREKVNITHDLLKDNATKMVDITKISSNGQSGEDEEKSHIEVREYISDDYNFMFDMDTPEINVYNPAILDGWSNKEQVLKLNVTDATGFIGRIVAFEDNEVVFEKRFKDDEKIKSIDCDIPIIKNTKGMSGNELEVKVYDLAYNSMTTSYSYYLDREVPEIFIDGVANGSTVTEDAVLTVGAKKSFLNTTYIMYKIEREANGEIVTDDVCINAIDNPNGRVIPIHDEGSYTINAFAYDLAGNRSSTQSISFTVDKNKADVFITGAEDEASYTQDVNLNVEIDKTQYKGCCASINIKRKRQQMSVELAPISYELDADKDVRNIKLVNDGDYEVTASVTDNVGRITQATKKFRIDTMPPRIIIEGLHEGEATNSKPKIHITTEEAFYDTTSVLIVLNKKNGLGQYEIIDRQHYVMAGEKDGRDVVIDCEGEYLLSCTATDMQGNSSREEVTFIVDYTPPVIQSLSDYDYKYVDRFIVPDNIKRMISDASDVNFEAYINDVSVNGGEEIVQEGRYVLWICAEDEAGNVSSKQASFIVDHTAPQIVIGGMGQDGIVKKGDVIEISLFDEQDKLESVVYEGNNILLTENGKRARIKVDKYGESTLDISAVDMAGNEARITLKTVCENSVLSSIKYVQGEKMPELNIVENDENDMDIKGVLIGLFTVLSGTYGLTYRGLKFN